MTHVRRAFCILSVPESNRPELLCHIPGSQLPGLNRRIRHWDVEIESHWDVEIESNFFLCLTLDWHGARLMIAVWHSLRAVVHGETGIDYYGLYGMAALLYHQIGQKWIGCFCFVDLSRSRSCQIWLTLLKPERVTAWGIALSPVSLYRWKSPNLREICMWETQHQSWDTAQTGKAILTILLSAPEGKYKIEAYIPEDSDDQATGSSYRT